MKKPRVQPEPTQVPEEAFFSTLYSVSGQAEKKQQGKEDLEEGISKAQSSSNVSNNLLVAHSIHLVRPHPGMVGSVAGKSTADFLGAEGHVLVIDGG